MKRIVTVFSCVCMVLALCSCSVVRRARDFSLAGIFADNMVLQREVSVPVFGTGENGITVTVSFNGQEKSTVIENGEWRVDLDAEPACKEGKTLSVSSSGGETVSLSNVLVGDVWLCSGQSNMYWKIIYCSETEQKRLYENIEREFIRSCYIEPVLSDTPQDTIANQTWVESSRETMAVYSAYATAFAQFLQEGLDIPIGIVTAAEGSTSIERWVSGGENYNAMIYPLQPFAFKGVLWYQGENNVLKDPDYKVNYPESFRQLCREWRAGFENEDMPVIQTQIAGYGMPGDTTWSDWAYMMVLQPTYTSDAENTYTVVNYDLGDMSNIHPNLKKAVGKRAAFLALEKIYGVEGYYGTAAYAENFEFTEDGLLITFGGVNERLETTTSTARGFELCGTDGVYVTAKASMILPDKILVEVPDTIDVVKGVRFNYGNIPSKTVFSGVIPAMSFIHEFE